jgi:heat shock protein HslJ
MLKKSPLLAALAVVLMLSGCFEDEKKAEAPAPAAAEIVETSEGEVSDAVVMDGGEEMPVEITEDAAPVIDISALTSNEWALQTIKGGALISGTSATLSVDAQGATVNGNGSCNNFSGRATIKDEGRIMFGRIMSTKRACVDMAQNSQESAYMVALGEVAAWNYDEENRLLSFINGRGEEVLVFSPVVAAEGAPETAPAEAVETPAAE